MVHTNEINFEVVRLEKARKIGYVAAEVKFEGSQGVYTFVRKDYGGSTVIDGCKVIFDSNYSVTGIERLYETKGIKKTDTSNIGKISDKIKVEMENHGVIGIEVEEEEQQPEVVEITDGPVKHEKYSQIKTCLECGIPVYLAGPAGSGKNHTVEQIAKENGWKFFFSNSVQQEYKLTGFIDAGGEYHETEFYKACSSDDECIFFLDEMDASIPEVLVLLNAAIANGYFEFPIGRVDFDLDKIHFVAAGNTVGSGADELYTGRMVLDQATLDRFAIIEFDYDKNIEMAITKGNRELVEFIRELRSKANQTGIRATFSYRCMTMVTKLEKSGMKLEEILKITVFKGMDKDTMNTLRSFGTTKYHSAMGRVA